MGSLSKLMQKLDELELPPEVQQSSAANAKQGGDEPAQPGNTQPEDTPQENIADAEPPTETATEEQVTVESTTGDEAATEASRPTKPVTWQPVTNAADKATEAEIPFDDSESLIDEADVEALLTEHGCEDDPDPPSGFTPDTESDVPATDDESASDETDLLAPEPIAEDELATELLEDLREDEIPTPTKTHHSSLFTTSPATEAEAEPASNRALDDDHQTVPWDAAKVDPAVIAFHNRYAAMCEQYRSLRARLSAMNPSGQHQIITVTSSVPEEGKSVTTMNLAICVAEGSQQRVLVVDADFRRASVARMVNAKHSPGMAELILGQQQLDNVLQDTPYPNLKLIAAGKLGAVSYGELLASPRIPAVFEQFRERFSYVLLDTPPVTTVSDVSMLAPLSDGALMVVEMGRTPEPTVQLAVRTLQTNNVNVLGCVLSRYRDQRKHYYDRYYDYYDRH